jgi:type VI secretion system protein ImpH
MTESKSGALHQLIESVRHAPQAVDLFALLRLIEALTPSMARLGYSSTPRDDAVRLGQYPSTIFAPTALFSIQGQANLPAPKVQILSIGLFGPNGPLPLHITEYVRDRTRNHSDNTLTAFADIFHHRAISLFYRAWADAQPTVHLDRKGQDRFSTYVGSLFGMGFEGSWQRDSVNDHAKLFATGQFVRPTRNPEGLCQILSHYFQVPVNLKEFVKTWIKIPPVEQSKIFGRTRANQLGHGALAGAAVPDIQSRFRLEIGPMRLAAFTKMLPGAPHNLRLRDWVRNYIGIELQWDADLLLYAEDVPQSQLGGMQQLGWTTWLGTRAEPVPARDLRVNPERDCQRFGRREM